MTSFNAHQIDVVMLCGGKGERLKPYVTNRPKPMLKIKGQPFLDILISYVAGFGFQRFILCISYLGDFIKKYYQGKNCRFEVLFSEEKEPLGTAGAIKNAAPMIKSNPFLVMNGDSFCRLDLIKFVNFHLKNKALFSMVLANAQNPIDYGSVTLDKSARIIDFGEKIKSNARKNIINAGIYLLDKSIFSKIPPGKNCSLEFEILPKLLKERFYGFLANDGFLDIGTPERFKAAKIKLQVLFP